MVVMSHKLRLAVHPSLGAQRQLHCGSIPAVDGLSLRAMTPFKLISGTRFTSSIFPLGFNDKTKTVCRLDTSSFLSLTHDNAAFAISNSLDRMLYIPLYKVEYLLNVLTPSLSCRNLVGCATPITQETKVGIMQWLYVYFPHLYGETWCPAFATEQPVGLVKETGNALVDCNTTALNLGITPQMLTNTAFCLAPTMQVETIQPHKEQQALLRAARLAYRFSAWIGLAPDGLYLEVATMRKLFGGLGHIRQQMTELFETLGHQVKIAAAPYPKAAQLLARNGIEVCIAEKQLTQFLQKMSIDCLTIPEQTLVRLQKLGLKTVQDVVQLPKGDLAYRIDSELADYLSQVTGNVDWRPTPTAIPEQFYHKVDLEQEFETLAPLLFPLSSSIRKYCQFMQSRCLVSQTLRIRLLHRDHPETLMPVELATADNRPDNWLYMLNRCIEHLRLPAPVNGFVLKASQFEDIPPTSLNLFQSRPGMQDAENAQTDIEESKAYLLNRLVGRIGAGNIQFIQLTDDPRPELQTDLTTQATVHKAFSEVAAEQQAEISHQPLEPLWLLEIPRPVRVGHYQLIRGPLRLDTGWWDKQQVKRDYYIALRQQSSPVLHWLYRSVEGQWFLHGIFG